MPDGAPVKSETDDGNRSIFESFQDIGQGFIKKSRRPGGIGSLNGYNDAVAIKWIRSLKQESVPTGCSMDFPQ